ncbi:MAG: hypothetical protein RL336_1608 [Pseudomonadota bacterium]|jgi:hypothetical protein
MRCHEKALSFSIKPLILLSIILPISAYASAEDPAVKAVLGAVMALQLMIFVGLYHLGKFLCRRVIADASILLQRVLGVAFTFVSYFLVLALLK